MWATLDEQLCQRRQDILTSEPSRDREGKALSAGLVDDRQDAELATIVRMRSTSALLRDAYCSRVPRSNLAKSAS